MAYITIDMDSVKRRCMRLCSEHIRGGFGRCEDCPLYRQAGCSYANWPGTGDIAKTLEILRDEGIEDLRGIGGVHP